MSSEITPEQQAVIDEATAERAAEAAEFQSFGVALPPSPALAALEETRSEPEKAKELVREHGFIADRSIQRPSIGRVVHAVDVINGERRIRKADICFVWSDDSVNLDITNHDGTHSVGVKVGYKEQEEGKSLGWEWPARV